MYKVTYYRNGTCFTKDFDTAREAQDWIEGVSYVGSAWPEKVEHSERGLLVTRPYINKEWVNAT